MARLVRNPNSASELSYDEILKLTLNQLGLITIRVISKGAVMPVKEPLNTFLNKDINDYKIFYDPEGDKDYYAAVRFFKLAKVNMLCKDLTNTQVQDLKKCNSIEDVNACILKHGEGLKKYFSNETRENLLNHYSRIHSLIAQHYLNYEDYSVLHNYTFYKNNSDDITKNKRIYNAAFYFGKDNVEDLTSNELIQYIRKIDSLIYGIYKDGHHLNPYLNDVHIYLDVLSSADPNIKLNIVMYRGYAENPSTTANRLKTEAKNIKFNFNRYFALDPNNIKDSQRINIPTILKHMYSIESTINSELALFPNSEAILIETTIYPNVPFVYFNPPNNSTIILPSGVSLNAADKNCLKEIELSNVYKENKNISFYCSAVGKPIVNLKIEEIKVIEKKINTAHFTVPKFFGSPKKISVHKLKGKGKYSKRVVKSKAPVKSKAASPVKSKAASPVKAKAASPVKVQSPAKAKPVNKAPTNWADEAWEEGEFENVVPQKGGKKLSLSALTKKLKEGKITKEKYNDKVRNVLRKYNSTYTKDLIKSKASEKKKIARLEKKLKLNINLFEQLDNGTFNYNKAAKIIEKINEGNTVQVGGGGSEGKTRMDDVKRSLKIYRRRYDNAKTDDARDKLDKLYNKILRNKTKLNIKYYKNKLNDLNKSN